jgi:hypothetical protein
VFRADSVDRELLGGSLLRRLLILLVFGFLLVTGGVVAWQARNQAQLVEQDLAQARNLLARAGGLGTGTLDDHLALIDQAKVHTFTAQQRLNSWPLRQLGMLPLVGRDVRVAEAVSFSAARTVGATRRVVIALQPIQAGPPSRTTILKAADALLALHRTLDQDRERVQATRPLIADRGRTRYLEAAGTAGRIAKLAGQGLHLAADLYGPSGLARWFLAFQNPAELRGTGGLIGEYGILQSSPSGPELTTVASYQALDARTKEGVRLSRQIAQRYERLAINQAWSSVNIPPDMPTVGRIITQLYREATGDHIDGVIAADPLAVAEILRASGPIQAGDIRLTAENVAHETLVRAYIRYSDDNKARKRFLELIARATFDAFPASCRHPTGRPDPWSRRCRPRTPPSALQQ